tara:strand:- start:91361 stop:91816 length:456 start_codon:yes stop_codon:yes gene_type:complete
MRRTYIERLLDKDYIIRNKTGLYLRDKGEKLIKIFVQIDIDNEIDDELNERVKEFRLLFKNIRTGSMGNLQSVKKKLDRFLTDNKDTSFEEVIQATELYIEHFNGAFKYSQRADYFIYKQNHRGEETSNLEIWLEEARKEPENSDWRTKLI